jgi:hypothetical protein
VETGIWDGGEGCARRGGIDLGAATAGALGLTGFARALKVRYQAVRRVEGAMARSLLSQLTPGGLVTALLACEDHQGTLAPDGPAAVASPAAVNASTASQIAQLRRLVAPFHDFDAAVRAGWAAPITPASPRPTCQASPGPERWGSTGAISPTFRTAVW